MNETEWLADLEAKADAATPGPWEDFSNHPDHIAGSVCKGERGIKHICLASFYESTDERQTITHKECLANASFIAAANPETGSVPTHLPYWTHSNRVWLFDTTEPKPRCMGRIAMALTTALTSIGPTQSI